MFNYHSELEMKSALIIYYYIQYIVINHEFSIIFNQNFSFFQGSINKEYDLYTFGKLSIVC